MLGWAAKLWHLSPTKLDLFVWHKSLGILLLLLALIRLGWRLANRQAPRLPKNMPRSMPMAERASHTLLYVFMLTIPLSGWIAHSAANIPLELFWLVPLPNLVASNKALFELAKKAHLALFVLLAAVLVPPITAALRHYFVYRDC